MSLMESLLYGGQTCKLSRGLCRKLTNAGANFEMIHISTVRESNAQCKRIEGLVTVFVGGTGGIGESTARELFLRTTRPKAYIVGR